MRSTSPLLIPARLIMHEGFPRVNSCAQCADARLGGPPLQLDFKSCVTLPKIGQQLSNGSRIPERQPRVPENQLNLFGPGRHKKNSAGIPGGFDNPQLSH